MVYVALGSNLGDRQAHLHAARTALASLPDTTLVAASEIEETEPLGGKQQPPYLNQMVLLETTLEPRALLQALQAIERQQGRERTERWLVITMVAAGSTMQHECHRLFDHARTIGASSCIRGSVLAEREGLAGMPPSAARARRGVLRSRPWRRPA